MQPGENGLGLFKLNWSMSNARAVGDLLSSDV